MRRTLPFALACVLTALLPAQTFVFNDFSSVAGIALNGNAAQFGTDLRLTPNSYSQTSSAWWNTPVPVAFGFNTRFSFSMTQPVVQYSNGADGIVFIIQNDVTGTAAIGGGGGSMGYGGTSGSIGNCLAIELDTWLSNHPSGISDLSNNEVSVHTNGPGPNSEDENLSLGRVAPTTTTLLDQAVHELEIHYVPGQLDLTLDGVPILSVPYDFFTGGTWVLGAGGPVSGLNLINGTDAYVGFTSATGADAQNHFIHSWQWVSFGPAGCEAGNVGAGAGGPFDVLTVNNSSGGGGRTVSVAQFAPLTFGMAQPPTTPLSAGFFLFGTIGFPAISDSFAISGLGAFCFPPFFLAPQNPNLFLLADSIAPGDPYALLPSNPAPWTFTLPGGIPGPVNFTLQGAIFHNTIPGIGGLAVTNVVQVNVF